MPQIELVRIVELIRTIELLRIIELKRIIELYKGEICFTPRTHMFFLARIMKNLIKTLKTHVFATITGMLYTPHTHGFEPGL